MSLLHNPVCEKCGECEYTLVGPREGDDYYECPQCGHTRPAFVETIALPPHSDGSDDFEEHWIGLPVGITITTDGRVRIHVDLTEATVEKNYDDEVTPEFLARMEQVLVTGDYTIGM